MTNKQKSLRAVRVLMDRRYLKGEEIYCPLCSLHDPQDVNECTGCPNTVFDHDAGCTYSKTMGMNEWAGKTNPRFLFWKEAYPTLEDRPSEAFTKRGYKDEYFKFLIEIDERIYNEHNK